jgi:hypothetical protein
MSVATEEMNLGEDERRICCSAECRWDPSIPVGNADLSIIYAPEFWRPTPSLGSGLRSFRCELQNMKGWH